MSSRAQEKESIEVQMELLSSEPKSIAINDGALRLSSLRRAVIVSCVYPPESLTSAFTSNSVAGALGAAGVDVVVLAPFPNRPGGRIYKGFRRRILGTVTHESGIRVIRCFSLLSRSGSLFSRTAENISFGFTSAIRLVCLKKPDVIYSNTWPIFATGLVAVIAHCRRIPLVLSIQDVFPESLVSLGKINGSGRAARLLKRWDAWICKRTAALIVISKQMRQIYSNDRKVPSERIHLICNWRDVEDLPEASKVSLRRREWQLSPDAFVFLFAGNVALACGIEDVVRAFAQLPTSESARMVVAGAGSALAQCRQLADSTSQSNVVFTGAFCPEETLEILGCGNVLILATQGNQALVSLPSKLISYMMAAKPIIAIANSQSDLAEIVEEAGCGWIVAPGDLEALCRLVKEVLQIDSLTLDSMGARGREYALAHFSGATCLPRLLAVIRDSVKHPSSSLSH